MTNINTRKGPKKFMFNRIRFCVSMNFHEIVGIDGLNLFI
jgi:hypothetical protein